MIYTNRSLYTIIWVNDINIITIIIITAAHANYAY